MSVIPWNCYQANHSGHEKRYWKLERWWSFITEQVIIIMKRTIGKMENNLLYDANYATTAEVFLEQGKNFWKEFKVFCKALSSFQSSISLYSLFKLLYGK